ncbi:MAG: hypothetical protein GF372_06755 [Candidatus Marinimicrobia bacterium]|nr:hypothetical protein [Candidatus Neomarinimicrobiota bacterium]
MKIETRKGERDNKLISRLNKLIHAPKIIYLLTGVILTSAKIFTSGVDSNETFRSAAAIGISIPEGPVPNILLLSVITVIVVRVYTKIYCASKRRKLKMIIYKKRKEIGYW